MTDVQYAGICQGARGYAWRLPPSIDWRDLAHEAVVKHLRGKRRSSGAMQDFIRRQPLVGRQRSTYANRLRRVEFDTAFNDLRTEPATDFTLMVKMRAHITALPRRERQVLIGRYWYGMSQEELATTIAVSVRCISKLHLSAISKLKEIV